MPTICVKKLTPLKIKSQPEFNESETKISTTTNGSKSEGAKYSKDVDKYFKATMFMK